MSLHGRAKRPDRGDRAELTKRLGRRLPDLARLRAERTHQGSLCPWLPRGAQRSNRRYADPGVDHAGEGDEGGEGGAASAATQRRDGLGSRAVSAMLDRGAENETHLSCRGTDEGGDRPRLDVLVEPGARRQREQHSSSRLGQRRRGPQAHCRIGIS
jgi:hypothetical protein